MTYIFAEQPALERAERAESLCWLLKDRLSITPYDAMAHTGLRLEEAEQVLQWFIERGFAEVVEDHDGFAWFKRFVGIEPNPPRPHRTPQEKLFVYRATEKLRGIPSSSVIIEAVFRPKEETADASP